MGILDNNESIAKIDKSGMLSVVESAAEHILETTKRLINVEIQKSFDGIIISGMGGSAIAGDVVSDLFFGVIKKAIYVNRGYALPESLDEKNLFIAISYSGETEETLSALKDAESKGMPIICISSGGKLSQIASAKKYPLVEIPVGFQPRAAFYMILTSLIQVFSSLKLIPSQKEAISESIDLLGAMKGEIGLGNAERSNPCKLMAQKIKDRFPIIFSSVGITSACGVRVKNQFNENAKIPAFSTVFPELNHNEIVGFAALKKAANPFAMIVLRDEEENFRIVKRIEITKSLVGVNLNGVLEIKSKGKSKLARMLSLIFFGDMLSCYLAIIRGTDPTPVDVITRLKKELKR